MLFQLCMFGWPWSSFKTKECQSAAQLDMSENQVKYTILKRQHSCDFALINVVSIWVTLPCACFCCNICCSNCPFVVGHGHHVIRSVGVNLGSFA